MTERSTIHLVIAVLACAGTALCVAAFVLAIRKGDYAPFLTTGSSMLGIIGGMLSSTRSTTLPVQPVSGPQGPSDPVEVHAVEGK